MVEFAILLPLLLVLVFGIIEFGRAYNASISLTHAAREGVREYAVTQDAAAGTAAARNAATSLDSGAMAITVSSCTFGDPTTMAITYPFTFNLPFVPGGTINLSAEGVMRCGG
ncbi:MAG: pilus assembly protein [Actinomycetia bacterium]|nr:pilus assembly protein [Actinomycetes bacterium]